MDPATADTDAPAPANDIPVNTPRTTAPISNDSPKISKAQVTTRLFGVPAYQAAAQVNGTTNFNYDAKYPNESPPGREASDNARVWMIYNDQAEIYDDDVMRALRDSIDSLLVFAALFSAIVTAFVVQTGSNLEPDHTQIATYLLAEQNLLLRANGNATAVESIPQSRYSPDALTRSHMDIIVNVLFFVSLALSLSGALFSVLVKQWLMAYSSKVLGTPKQVALVRNFRFIGLQKWKLQEFVGFLPFLLHASLGLFAAGLLVYISQRDMTVFYASVGIFGLTGIIYMASLLIPPFFPNCPYHIGLLDASVRSLVNNSPQRFHQWWKWIQFLSAYIGSYFANKGAGQRRRRDLMPPKPAEYPLQLRREWERNVATQSPHNLSSAVVWLHDHSTNPTVHRAAALALAGVLLDDTADFRESWRWRHDAAAGQILCQSVPLMQTIWKWMAESSLSLPLPTSTSELQEAIKPSSPTYNPWVRAEILLHSWTYFWGRTRISLYRSDRRLDHEFPMLNDRTTLILKQMDEHMPKAARLGFLEYFVNCTDVIDRAVSDKIWVAHRLDWNIGDPFRILAQNGDPDLILPLSHYADINQPRLTRSGEIQTPFSAAVYGGSKMVDAFLEAGADPTCDSNSAIRSAFFLPDILLHLLNQPNVVQKIGMETDLSQSLFTEPIEDKNVEAVKVLLQVKVQVSPPLQASLLALAKSQRKYGTMQDGD
ncbi:hypothetical protein DL96DRAFT_1812717 [Flagelloscypha sp. PMI_526]|nr:hypothetical protein DL96DRAFT_1812717 [Flagelloscypha sp. PMI_526]